MRRLILGPEGGDEPDDLALDVLLFALPWPPPLALTAGGATEGERSAMVVIYHALQVEVGIIQTRFVTMRIHAMI